MGMRVCLDGSQLNEAFDSVARLAQSNFHNAGLYLERYIPFARHVEVQILETARERLWLWVNETVRFNDETKNSSRKAQRPSSLRL